MQIVETELRWVKEIRWPFDLDILGVFDAWQKQYLYDKIFEVNLASSSLVFQTNNLSIFGNNLLFI